MKSQWRDGLKKLGPGKWLARITWTDAAGKRRDTERVIHADTRGEALQKREALAQQLARPSTCWTVGEAIDKLMPTLRPGTLSVWKSHAKKVRATFGERSLDDVKPDELRRFLAGLTVSDVTASNVRSLLTKVWEFARDAGRFDGQNPVRLTNARKTPRTSAQLLAELENPPRRAFHADEIGLFLAAIPGDMRAMMTLQLLLGCRFGEASALQWADVDLDTGRVRIVRTQYNGSVGPTKGKRARWTSLGPGGVAILKTQRATMEAAQWPGWETWCFPRRHTGRTHRFELPLWDYRDVSKAVKAAKVAIGTDVVANTHALRHTFVTIAHAQQVERSEAVVLRSMVGHASEAQTYTYLDQRQLPADPMAARIEKALVGESVGDGSETSDVDGKSGRTP